MVYDLDSATTSGGMTVSDRIIIRNGIVVTLNDADDVHFGGAVVIDGDHIAHVGESDVPTDGAKVIDATDKIVMPGLVDFHYHTALGKGWSYHLPLWEYLQTCWYPMIRALDPESAYWAALASYSESIKCGVTAVNDMYRRLEAGARPRSPTTAASSGRTASPRTACGSPTRSWRSCARRTRRSRTIRARTRSSATASPASRRCWPPA